MDRSKWRWSSLGGLGSTTVLLGLFSLLGSCSPRQEPTKEKQDVSFERPKHKDSRLTPEDRVPNEWILSLPPDTIAEEFSGRVETLLASMNEDVEIKTDPLFEEGDGSQGALLKCLALDHKLFRVKSRQPLADETFYTAIEGLSVNHAEPHSVVRLVKTRYRSFGLLQSAYRHKDFRLVLERANQYLRDYEDRSRSYAVTATLYRLEALFELERDDALQAEAYRLLADSRFSSGTTQSKIYRFYWHSFLRSGKTAERLALEEHLLSHKRWKNSKIAGEIRRSRKELEKSLPGSGTRTKEGPPNYEKRLEELLEKEAWVVAAKWAVSKLKSTRRAAEILLAHYRQLPGSVSTSSLVYTATLLTNWYRKQGSPEEEHAIYSWFFSVVEPSDTKAYFRLLEKAYERALKDLPERVRDYEVWILEEWADSELAKAILKERAEREEERRRLEEERLEKIAAHQRKRFQSITSLSDPLSDYLWGFHSRVAVSALPKEKGKSREYRVSTPMPSAERFDLFLDESLASGEDHLQEIKVGVVDTGIDFSHPDLKSIIATNEGEMGEWENAPEGSHCKRLECNRIDDDGNGFVDDWRGFNFAGRNNFPQDDNGHGTHVSGTIAAAFDGIGLSGINPKAKIVPIKVLKGSGSGPLKDVMEGFVYAALAGARIINASLGSNFYSQSAQKVVHCLYRNGVLMIAAAGNQNRDIGHFPSDYDPVVSVAATNFFGEKAYFSNYSSNVSLAAPGEQILSTWPLGLDREGKNPFLDSEGHEAQEDSGIEGYASLNGTSMASPMVAGVASLLWSERPEAKEDEVRARLLLGAKAISKHEPEVYKRGLGAGIVNVPKSQAVERQPFIETAQDAGTQSFFISRSKQETWSQPFELGVRVLWEDALEVGVSLAKEDEQLGTLLLEEETLSLKRGMRFQKPITAKLNEPILERTRAYHKLRFQTSEHSVQDRYVSIEWLPFFSLFYSPQKVLDPPSHRFWWPESYDWGVFTALTPEGNLLSASRRRASDRFSDIFQLVQTSPMGETLSSTRVHFLDMGLGQIVGPIDFDRDGEEEIILTSHYSAQSKKTLDQDHILGFNVMALDGAWKKQIPLDETRRFVNLRAIPGVGLAAAVRVNQGSRDLPKLEYAKEWAFVRFFDTRFDYITEIPLITATRTSLHLAACERSKRFAVAYQHEAATSTLRLYDAEGEKIGESVFEQAMIEGIQCVEHPDQGELLFVHVLDRADILNMKLLAFDPTQIARVDDDGRKVLASKFTVSHRGYNGRQLGSFVELEGQKGLLVNTAFDEVNLLTFDGTWVREKGIRAPADRLNNYFLSQAINIDLGGNSFLMLVEAHDRVHFFDSLGNYSFTLSLPGHFYGKPLETKDAVYLTSYQGLQKIEKEEIVSFLK